MKRAGPLAAVGIIVIANAMVLMEVAHNRRGGPVETIRLTERELPVNFRENENSEVSVRLDWRRPPLPAEDDYSWLDRTKLEGIGFDYARALANPLPPPLPRPAFIVLEYNGSAWEKWQSSTKHYQSPDPPPEMYSRLFPIDAARTPEPLMRKYPDHERYLIVKGLVQLRPQPQLQPLIFPMRPESFYVPLPLSRALGRFAGSTSPQSPRYTVTLSYGRNFEPWIVLVGNL
jgi:hypothetical protein